MASINTQPSVTSSALSSFQNDPDGNGHQKVKLRLCYGGRFEQTANNAYKFVGGEYFNESIPYGIKYADFMFKLSEKFRTAVSVKYHAPGEELVPEQLISVQDDADLQELMEDYLAHLQRPGTPCKTFRIKVFVFMAAEEPLTPDEIMEGQHFFSESQLSMPARLNAVRLLDGRSSFGSTLSSVGTPSTRQQDLSAEWPPNSSGQGGGAGRDELAAQGFSEQELLERMRSAVSCNPPQHLRQQQQRRLSAFAGLEAGAVGAAGQEALADAAAAEAGVDGAVDDSAYEDEEVGDSMLRQISQEMEEVLQAIDAQQQEGAVTAVSHVQQVHRAPVVDILVSPPGAVGTRVWPDEPYEGPYEPGYDPDEGYADYDAAQSDYQSDAHTSHTPYTDVWEGEDGTEVDFPAGVQQEQVKQQPQQHAQAEAEAEADAVDQLVRALPTHISDFGDSADNEDDAALLEGLLHDGAAATASAAGAAAAAPAERAPGPPAAAAVARLAGAAAAAAAANGDQGAAAHLPSHISAFGDDLEPLTGGRDVLSAGAELEEGFPTGLEPRLSGGQLGRARPRTQDSSFSLDGGAFDGEGTTPSAAGAERAGSGDSLTNLPKLQPVHRLAKPDLKIVQRIGEGAFGEVSVAKAPLYGTVAVKWLKSERFTKHFASFGREAALLADLNHPNVLRFYGVVTESAADNTVIGIMTEYIRGGSMSSFLRMARTLLPLHMRCELALGAANGLAYLHELCIVHFDLKPDNLLLDAPPAVVKAAACSGSQQLPEKRVHAADGGEGSLGDDEDDEDAVNSSQGGPAAAAAGVTSQGSTPEPGLQRGGSSVAAAAAAGSPAVAHAGGGHRRGDSSPGLPAAAGAAGGSGSATGTALMEPFELPVVKVADFGLSKHKLNSSYVSSCRDLRGTLPYMAPELVADPERVCEKADVWSLGVVMWEMMTRQTPFQELAPQQILLGLMCGSLHLDIPEWCEPEWRFLLEACMEPNPNNRPTMRELARQLEAIRDQQLQHEQELQELQAQQQQLQQEAQEQEQQQVQQQQEQQEQVQQQQLHKQAMQGLYQEQHQQQQQLLERHEQQQQQLLERQEQQQQQLLERQEQQAVAAAAQPCSNHAAQQQHCLPVSLQNLPPLPLPPQQQQHCSLPSPVALPSPQQHPLPSPQQHLQLLQQVPVPHHPLHQLPAGQELGLDQEANGQVYGAVCEHYWPQQ